MGLVKVETQTGDIEGKYDKHNTLQFFAETHLGGGKILKNCDLQFKEILLLRKFTSS